MLLFTDSENDFVCRFLELFSLVLSKCKILYLDNAINRIVFLLL